MTRVNLFSEQFFAGLRAPSARFGADPAMLQFCSVLCTHRAANFASLDAGSELRARKLEVGAGETGDDTRRGQAHVRAIIAIADALGHLRHIPFAEAGISAGIA